MVLFFQCEDSVYKAKGMPEKVQHLTLFGAQRLDCHSTELSNHCSKRDVTIKRTLKHDCIKMQAKQSTTDAHQFIISSPAQHYTQRQRLEAFISSKAEHRTSTLRGEGRAPIPRGIRPAETEKNTGPEAIRIGEAGCM